MFIAGKWFDLVIEDTSVSPVTASQHNNSIAYASQYIPLWVGIADMGSDQAAAVTQSFLQSGLIQVGGISTSTFNSSQQWDFPNCWAPVQVCSRAVQCFFGAKLCCAQRCQAMTCGAVLCCAVRCGAVLCHAAVAKLCHAVLCCARLCHAVLCCARLCHAVRCQAMLCCVVLCCARLCHAVPCQAMPCCAVPSYAMLCCAVLCCVVLHCTVLCCACHVWIRGCKVPSLLRCAILCCVTQCRHLI